MLRFPRLLPLAALLGTAACAGDFLQTGPDFTRSSGDLPAVVTSASSYTLTSSGSMWSGEIRFSFTNLTGRRLSLPNCHGQYGVMLEKWEDGKWVPGYIPVQLACSTAPIVIRAGGTRDDVLWILAGRQGSNVYPQFSVTRIDGTYRLVIGGSYGGPPWFPLDLRVSDPFEIRTG